MKQNKVLASPILGFSEQDDGSVIPFTSWGAILTQEEFKDLVKRVTLFYKTCEASDKEIRVRNDEVEQQKAAKHSQSRRKPQQLPGYVYIICAPDNGMLYKIGKAANVKSRLAAYKTSPVKIEVKQTIPTADPYKLESKLHKLFGKKRVKGEWFKLTETDLKFLKERYPNESDAVG